MKSIFKAVLIMIFVFTIPNVVELAACQFRFATKSGQQSAIKQMPQCWDDGTQIDNCGGTDGIRLNYIAPACFFSIFYKYKMSCNNHSDQILVWRWSPLNDSIDARFNRMNAGFIY